jgi:tetratricopeptide (TPR) repeat protein
MTSRSQGARAPSTRTNTRVEALRFCMRVAAGRTRHGVNPTTACWISTVDGDRSDVSVCVQQPRQRLVPQSDFDRAIADYDEAIQLDPKDAQAYYDRGMAWEKKRRLREALADFKMHSQLAPSDPDGLEAVRRVSKELSAR